MTKGNLSKWVKSEGEEVMAGDVVAEIETDKASMEMDSQEEGFLAKILVGGGTSDIEVGTPIAILAEEEADVTKFKDYSVSGLGSGGENAASSGSSSESGDVTSTSDTSRASRLGPAVQRLVRQGGVDISGVAGTGPFGIITKGDALGLGGRSAPPASKSPSASSASPKTDAIPENVNNNNSDESPSVGDEFEDVPHTTVRKIIAKGLLESKHGFPHQYVSADVKLDNLLEFRKELKSMGVVASVNDFIVKAVALSLREVPQLNAYWDREAEAVVLNDSVDVAVAVATDGGLITPVVFDADVKKVSAINEEVKDLAARARANKLKPEEFQGGTFTISNLGMFGVSEFKAIINPYGSQGCIMAVGGGQEKVQLVGGKPTATTVMTASLSVDGRAYGGEAIAAFLQSFVLKLENPSSLLM
jgi:pyruvate dehydrogenase complex dihydrolipoamide acetyltransferase long form